MEITKILLISMIGLLLVSVVPGYMCINSQEDNVNVQEFKAKINTLALENELTSGITQEAFELKLKYFGPCNH